MGYAIWIGVTVVVCFYILPSVIIITPGKRAKILETLGKPHRTARMPGFSVKLPWPLTAVVGTINLQLQEIGADVSVKTKDNAFMTLPVKVQYRASSEPEGAVKAHYELEDPEEQIKSYVLNNVRQTASSMDMIDLYQNRDAIEKQVRDTLQERFAKFGYIIENVLVDEPQPSVEVRDAFNRVIASQREKEAAENIAEAKRIELVGIAKAEKESKKLQGEGIAEMREAISRGMSAAMNELVNAGLNADQALGLLMDTNRLDTLGGAAQHGNMVLMDMNGGNRIAETMAAVASVDGVQNAPVKKALKKATTKKKSEDGPWA